MSNNSKVLSLKYRPQVFEDLIGQEEVKLTICNSFELKKIPNAYLFFGIRGSGKTSIARIIAKALNCKNGFEKLCKEDLCENCESISNSNHIDILEIKKGIPPTNLYIIKNVNSFFLNFFSKFLNLSKNFSFIKSLKK